ncbi:MAG: Asp-tRNA(Asn)/Glu-tRNA(Gln) amidotransferase subunit GatB [Bacteroidia bacterium]|nr:Asp-tRNA(Asn)/Glu-tRNA(Gln) amidotransferase subunit GatB [Bacteroidia bacterium]NNC85684.1 Asp-tRNA(Asn)/Glu-tRNA(Gln) amidotransferase subunit GatB [Bacteroidia bacterium]NNM16114.1 Asp-tRNA(Asn)/Glu-tRNA(Gln) amidotransferase subunit GatB [Bacteroidia bacterium]
MTESKIDYVATIGLEVHIQLSTNSKAYSSDNAAYGGSPNSYISPITLGHPGTLPVVNKGTIESAVKLGLAVDAKIRRHNEFARKNYFYPDLPKGYQITQDTTPICTEGHITIKANGAEKNINLTRIHMEEDAGKSIHDLDPFNTLVDLNRAGVPLLEMVSEPEIENSEEAYQYLMEVRKLVRYLGICDGNMEEGSLRCDANISVRPKGQKELGTKVEVKNMNSMRNVQRAIEHEIVRQIDVLNEGGTLEQQTRNFDAGTGTTTAMRSKEAANDYRYFPEPDLAPVVLSDEFIDSIKSEMPALPNELYKKYISEYALSEYDSALITESKETVELFESILNYTSNYKAAANWIMGPIKSYANENGVHVGEVPITSNAISELIELVEGNKVSSSVASQKLFPELIKKQSKNPLELAQEMNLIQESDESALNDFVNQAISKFPDKVEEYKNGKKGLIGLFMGEVMKLSKGKADPKIANKLVKDALEK